MIGTAEFTLDEYQLPNLVAEAPSGEGPEAAEVLKQILETYRHFVIPISRIGLPRMFLNLQTSWKREKELMSSLTEIVMNLNYQRIIGLGPQALPLILQSLREEPDYWFHALHAITGEDPVTPEDRGDIQAMTIAWLDWGLTQGFIS